MPVRRWRRQSCKLWRGLPTTWLHGNRCCASRRRGSWASCRGCLNYPWLCRRICARSPKSIERTIQPDGSLADDASPELNRIRREQERQQRVIEESLRAALRKLAGEGATQDDLITIRGERFVIPVRAELKRRVSGVIHGASSSGQTVYVEPLETIEQNNELVRLIEEEQAEIHRIFVALTRQVAGYAQGLVEGARVLALGRQPAGACTLRPQFRLRFPRSWARDTAPRKRAPSAARKADACNRR